ncbi:MAG: hypothetical protein AB7I59_23725 [Geminicoccaceae bacterium]
MTSRQKNDGHDITLPDGWPDNSFSAYMLNFFQNQLACFELKRGPFLRIERIDKIFFNLLGDWQNPKGLIEALLCYRTHSAFRTASVVTMAGALTESFALQRVCLEQAGYAIRMGGDNSLAEAWLRRDEDKFYARIVRAEFTHAKIKNAIAVKDIHTSNVYSDLYERCISWGAHPNEKSLTIGGAIEKEEGLRRYGQIYLHGDGEAMNMALKTLMQVAVCSLDILSLVFPDRVKQANLVLAIKSVRARL